MRLLRIVFGVIVGYAAMAVLITLVQETWLGGVGYYESSLVELGVAGFFTFLSAAVGAAVGTAIAGVRTRAVAATMSVLVVIETTVLTVSGSLSDPLWFDMVASASLIVGILLGGELVRRRPGHTAVAPAA